jgi:hypothetical protein
MNIAHLKALSCKSSQMVHLLELQKSPGGGILPSNIERVACMAEKRLCWANLIGPSRGVFRERDSAAAAG